MAEYQVVFWVLIAGGLLGWWIRPRLDSEFMYVVTVHEAERAARLREYIREIERPTAGDWAVMHRLINGISRSPKEKRVTKPIPMTGTWG